VRQCQRNRSAAGAQVGDVQRAAGRQTLQCQFDQQFGFRPGDQGRRGDLQIEAPESTPPHQIRHRLPGNPACEQLGETRLRGGVELVVAVRIQPPTRLPQHVGEQPFRVARPGL
jgi:hypothetical protein